MNNIYAIWDKDKNTLSGEYSIKQLLGMKLPPNAEIVPNYYNAKHNDGIRSPFRDSKGNVIREFDVIKLPCGPEEKELWSGNNAFRSSNIGKEIKRLGDIKALYVGLTEAGNDYYMYFQHLDGYIRTAYDGKIDSHFCFDGGASFIAYLVCKNAYVVSNTLVDPDFFEKLKQPLSTFENKIDYKDMFILYYAQHAIVYDAKTEKKLACFRIASDYEKYSETDELCGIFEAFFPWEYNPFYSKPRAVLIDKEKQREMCFDELPREWLENFLLHDIMPVLEESIRQQRDLISHSLS